MSVTVESLSEQALGLSPDERLALARRLLESVELEPEPGAEAAWEAEIAQRLERLDSGTSRPIPADEVFERLRRAAPGR